MNHQDDLIDVLRDFSKTDATKDMDPHWTYGRRGFLKSGVAAAATVAMPFSIMGARQAHAVQLPYSPDYGPLAPVNDEVTGLPLLQLPEGFKYWSFGWTGDVMTDGIATPGAHDGMAVVASDANKLVLVRNHEQSSRTAGSFANAKITYDPTCNGGTTNLVFAPRSKQWVGSYASISGTIRNCAGGPTPWNSWITCEETSDGVHNGATKQHGYCFDVPASGAAKPVPLVDMGCFSHEAVAVDPVTGIIYETEDSTPSGFYRFIPKVPGNPAAGGKLQMMKVVASTNASRTLNGVAYPYFNTAAADIPAGTTWDVEWVDIDEPNKPFITGTTYGGVVAQGIMKGASSITRGEGCWYGNGQIFVCSTSGGATGNGQIFAYDPRKETFSLLFVSGGNSQVDNPDNIAWSPRGSLILCEDGDATPQALRGLTLDGTIFPFCYNNVNFSASGTGSYTRPSGRSFTSDQRGSEFCGATFHNEWLFVNIQSPGITFAITGPWDNGAL
ncbi:PhoX family protein [Methyloversatilis thermotolerans]|uniref:PhoX family protein n=1 Tax=Methyloversatilis thermotolerans TaxID=1346290 RepID=UPI00037A7175|nr:alkaline phosphatase PhoX [Methyloversatilis thermotolerans]